jgi:peptide methionine sulfoxide reductase MsrA
MWYDTIVADNSPQAKFSTIVEYCGGKEPSPTYRRIKDYIEAIWIEYNPDLISFDTLIQHWFQQHYPTYPTTNNVRVYYGMVTARKRNFA